MALGFAVVLFGTYVADVFLGAMAEGSFLTDIQEMMVLFAASIAFSVGVLGREKKEKED